MSASGVPDEIAAMREHVQGAQRECVAIDQRALLRDATCVRALLDAADCRATGDDAELLLGESVAVLTANVWHACWESEGGTWPAPVLDAAGRLGALARARYAILQEAISAPDDRHSFLVDQIGWLGAIAQETATRLIEELRAMKASDAGGGAA